jgi:hypothetical protein
MSSEMWHTEATACALALWIARSGKPEAILRSAETLQVVFEERSSEFRQELYDRLEQNVTKDMGFSAMEKAAAACLLAAERATE